ncbi:MAG: hypothetical protein Q7S43_00125 [bacterium]|nr:hypothetical protein [bacterium]
MFRSGSVLITWLVVIIFAGNAQLSAQKSSTPILGEQEIDSIQCWLKSDKSFIRIGETFMLTLTCQVAETEYEKVVPSESMLEPAVVALSPYEVVEGWHHPDIKNGTFRLFQYQYRLRLVGEDFFGKEVPVPSLEIKYQIERKINKENFDSREKSYQLPALQIKVASIVPKDAKDIIDVGNESFSDVKTHRNRAYVAFVLAGVLFLVPMIALFMPIIRSIHRVRKAKSNGTGFSNAALLRRIKRELPNIPSTGWNNEQVGKVLTILRIMGAIALSREINQLSTRFESRGLEGQLKLQKGFFRPEKVLISSSLTPEIFDSQKHLLNNGWADSFSSVFHTFNDIRYGNDDSLVAKEGSRLDATFLVITKDLLKKIKR